MPRMAFRRLYANRQANGSQQQTRRGGRNATKCNEVKHFVPSNVAKRNCDSYSRMQKIRIRSIAIVSFIDSDIEALLEQCWFSVIAIYCCPVCACASVCHVALTIWHESNKNLLPTGVYMLPAVHLRAICSAVMRRMARCSMAITVSWSGWCKHWWWRAKCCLANDTYYVLMCLTTPPWCK